MKKYIIIGIFILFFVSLVLFLRSEYISSIITPIIVRTVKSKTDIDIKIERTYISLLPLGIGFYNLRCSIPSVGDIKAARVSAGISVIRLLYGKIYIKNILIDTPEISLELPQVKSKGEKAGKESKIPELPPVSIKNFNLRNGSLSLKGSEFALNIDKFSIRFDADLRAMDFDTELNLKGVNLSLNKNTYNVSSFVSILGFKQNTLKIFKLNMLSEGNEISIAGDVKNILSDSTPILNLKLQGELDASSFRKYLADLPRMKGKIELTTNLRGNLHDLNYQGKLFYNTSGLEELSFGNVRTDFSGNTKELRFYNTEIDLAGGKINADGKLILLGKPGIKVNATLSELSFAKLLDNLTLHNSHVDSEVTGRVSLEGNFAPFKLEGNVDIIFKKFQIMESSYISKSNRTIFSIHADTRVVSPILIDDRKVELSGATIYADGNNISANVHLGYDDFMKIEYSSAHFPLSLVFPIADFDMRGVAELNGTVEGKYSNPEISGKMKLSDAGLMFFNLGNVEGEIEFYDMVMSLNNMTIYADDMNVYGNGKIDFHNPMSMELDTDIEYADLGRLLWLLGAGEGVRRDFTGATSGKIKLSGAIEKLDGQITLTMESPSIYGIEFNSGTADIELKDNKVVLNELNLKGEPQFIYITGLGDYKEKWLKGDFILSNLPLSTFKSIKNLPVSGYVLTKGNLSFDKNGYSGRIDMLLDNLSFAEMPVGKSSIVAKFNGWEMTINGNLFGDSVLLSSALMLRAPYQYSMEMLLNDWNLEPVVKYYLSISQPEGNIKGVVKSSGFLNDLSRAEAKMTVDSLRIGKKDLYFKNDTQINIFYNNGIITVHKFRLTGDNLTLLVSGERSSKGINDFKISGSISLKLLDALADFITVGKGNAEIELRVTGPDSELKSYGYLNLYNGTLGFKNFPGLFENIDTELTLIENMLLIDGFYARCGGGDVGISGGIMLSGLLPQKYKISGSIYDVYLPTILIGTDEEFPGKVSGGIQFTGPASTPLLSGELTLKEAKYTSNVNWQTKVLKIRTRKFVAKGIRKEGTKLTMQLHINIPDSITIKNNLADLTVGGELSILGTIPDIYILGELVLSKGAIFFQSESFKLTSGVISFKDTTGISPFFDISGVTDKEDEEGQKYRITVNISGSLDDTKINFVSDPPLSEKDVLSMLRYGVRSDKIELAGATSSEIYSFGGQVLIGELMNKEEVKDILSKGFIDKVELHPYTSERGRTTTLLTLSKTFKDRFKLKYSTDVGGATQYMWAVTEYSFGKYISVIGTWDNEVLDNTTNKVGNLGVDFSVHYEF
jgi:hypothetical protein